LTECVFISVFYRLCVISAIDMTHDIRKALETVIELGFTRVLTSGGDSTALEGLPTLNALVKQVIVFVMDCKSSFPDG